MPKYLTKEELFASMVGKTVIKIINNDHLELVFKCDDGSMYLMYHAQDCCEDVHLEEIIGDLNDLLGHPILQFDERVNPPEVDAKECTWTFYELRTIQGSVTLRWIGESNGYYSEEVHFIELTEKEKEKYA